MSIAVGIDVGGSRKGFHAVALQGSRVIKSHKDTDAHAIAQWCADVRAAAIAVDSPAGWGREGGLRLAERELQRGGLHFYATPTRQKAAGSPFYAWMFNGESLFKALGSVFPVLDRADGSRTPVFFETFPHAVVVHLTNGRSKVGSKVVYRRSVLSDEGIDPSALSNVDFVDAGLCALTANRYLAGQVQFLGDTEGGFLVLPKRSNR